MTIIGLDIGGANLKAAAHDGRALEVPFALWKNPDHLPAMLDEVLAQLPRADLLAVTMTGELCDCYGRRREGVLAILDAVEQVAKKTAVRVWTNQGRFADMVEARREPLTVASANWLALATYVGRMFPQGPVLLLDIGTTTTDIVPILDGKPAARGRSDHERMLRDELVYLGWRRTPVCAVMRGVAAELFATMHDVALVLGLVPEDAEDRDTADSRPATRAFAEKRLARMWGADAEDLEPAKLQSFADQALRLHQSSIRDAIYDVCGPFNPPGPWLWVLAGSGEFLGSRVWQLCTSAESKRPVHEAVSLGQTLGGERSSAACAVAVAALAADPASPTR